MIRLIGLAGPARVGKSSAANVITETLGFEQYALSEPIKACINALFGWDQRHAEGSLKETVVDVSPNWSAFEKEFLEYGLDELLEFDPTSSEDLSSLFALLLSDHDGGMAYDADDDCVSPRRAYQLFGTEFGRALRPTIWLDCAKRKLDALGPNEGLVITDIRFPNEHRWLSYAGGMLIHVRRQGAAYQIADNTHESEVGLENMAPDWQTPFCEDLEMLRAAILRACQFAQFSTTSDVRISGRMKTFEQAYGDRL